MSRTLAYKFPKHTIYMVLSNLQKAGYRAWMDGNDYILTDAPGVVVHQAHKGIPYRQ